MCDEWGDFSLDFVFILFCNHSGYARSCICVLYPSFYSLLDVEWFFFYLQLTSGIYGSIESGKKAVTTKGLWRLTIDAFYSNSKDVCLFLCRGGI